MFTLEIVISLIGLLITGICTLVTAVKYLVDRMDKLNDDCHRRISDMTKRSDFDQHVQQMLNNIDALRQEVQSAYKASTTEMHNLTTQLSSRLDNILLHLKRD